MQMACHHADRIAHAFLMVDDIFLRNRVYYLLLLTCLNGAGRHEDLLDVGDVYLLVVRENSYGGVMISPDNVKPVNAQINIVYVYIRAFLGFLHNIPDGRNGFVYVYYIALLYAPASF